MKYAFRGVSGAALLLGLAGALPAAEAQQSAQTGPQDQTVTTTQQAQGPQAPPAVVSTTDPQAEASEGNRVTVIGSLIATTPEDAPKPVEVFTAQDLKEQGSPSITEFLRSLTAATPNTTGTASTTTGAAILTNGFVSVDLRGQGSNGTLVMMNGRRLASTNGGAGADVNTIPTEALEAVEVLKDGASATYGAGAVGGVINFRTRRDIDAPQISVTRQLYDGSDGVTEVNFLTGWVGDASNLMISLSHKTEGSLLANQRSFSNKPYEFNPTGWSLANLPNRVHKWTAWNTGTTVGGSVNDFSSNADCATLGGELLQDLQNGPGATTPTACAFPLARVSELVSESTQDQAYGEFNANLTETMEFHFDVTYSKYESTGRRPPSSGVGTARAMDSGVSASCALSCFYLIPGQVATYTTAGAATASVVANPFVADYNARQPGTAADLAAADALLTSANWRPYLFGGNPLFGNDLAISEVQRERLLFNAGVKGEFTEGGVLGFLSGIRYDFNGQFNQYIQTNKSNGDWLVNRLQDAMMGYGGPGCKAIDRVRTDYTSAASFNRTIGIQSDTPAGTNGCMWFNPFQSNFTRSIFSGATNPNFPTGATSPNWGANATQAGQTGPNGFLNNQTLLEWIWATRRSEIQYQAGTFDALFSGEVPENFVSLPGGAIGWAAGAQWRMTERRGLVQEEDQDELELLMQECPYSHTGQVPQGTLPPGQTSLSRGCAGNNGTGNFFSGASQIQPNPGLDPPDYIDSQTLAIFAELSLPVLDNLNFSASLRNESFNGGDIDGTIWSVAGKWDVTDNLYVRGSYGTNFRAEASLDAIPGAVVDSIVTDTTRFNAPGLQYVRSTTTAADIRPEDDRTTNFGIGWRSDLGEGRLRASVDFFKIDVRDSVTTTLATTVLDNVLGRPRAQPTTILVDCSARLISFIQTDTGTCVQGTTTAANIRGVLSTELNGPGLTTEGLDYSLDFSYPVLDGFAGLSVNVTQNTKYFAEPFLVGGVVFDEGGSRLGYINTSQTGSASQRLRGNASLRFSNDQHTVSLRANYVDGYKADPNTTPGTPIVNLAGTANDVFTMYGFTRKDYVDYDINYIWQAPFWEELELRASVLNITDRDPPAQQSSNGYVAQIGNPRGRRIELGITKKF